MGDCLHWVACANACGTNRDWRHFVSVAQLRRFDAKIWPDFNVSSTQEPLFQHTN